MFKASCNERGRWKHHCDDLVGHAAAGEGEPHGETHEKVAQHALVPKFAESNRLKGTDQEYRAVMQSMISGFGTYTIEGDTGTIK
jgi:hypothetical protein